MKAKIIVCRRLSRIERIFHLPREYLTAWELENGVKENVYTIIRGGALTHYKLEKKKDRLMDKKIKKKIDDEAMTREIGMEREIMI